MTTGHFPEATPEQIPLAEAGGENELALYIHWPFCASKCPYCDFNVHIRDHVEEDRFVRALCREIKAGSSRAPGRRLVSIFFGGGTPSRLSPGALARLLACAGENFVLPDHCEVTLEANPRDLDPVRLAEFRAAGINRLSIGVQSIEDRWLAWLGRDHDARGAEQAIAWAHEIFGRFSFDLISTRPGQTRASWAQELAKAAKLAGGHISIYQLTFSRGARFGRDVAKGRITPPCERLGAAIYRDTCSILADSGFASYEISNFARGPDHVCRHNLHVWRYGSLLGVGPGAHGRLSLPDQTGYYTYRRIRSPESWLATVEESGEAFAEIEPITPDACALEKLLLGLRLSEGVPLAGIEQAIDPASLAELRRAKLVRFVRGRIRTSSQGRLRLDAVIARLANAS